MLPVSQRRTPTPASYLSWNEGKEFPVPEKKPVGLLACQRDPLLWELESTVIRCDKVVPEPQAAKGKAGGKKKGSAAAPASEEVAEDEWEVELLDTVIFPEGGGQPSDQGTLYPLSSTSSESQGAKVRQVIRRGLAAVHYVSAPVVVGTSVRAVVDQEGREDRMAQHTGQHLLSGVIDRDIGVDTVAWALTDAPQPCYVELAGALTPQQIEQVQASCNAVIKAGVPITVDMRLAGTGARPEKLPEDYPSGHASGTAEGVSEAEEQGVIREVTIQGLGDRNPCCGTHWPSTSYLGSIFILPHTTTIRGTNTRLYFLVGPRVLTYLSSLHSTARSLSLDVGCGISELEGRMKALRLSHVEGGRREKKLREELAAAVATASWATAGEARRGVLVRTAEDQAGTNDIEFLTLVAASVAKLAESQTGDWLFVLASSSPRPPRGGALLVVGTEKLVADAGAQIRTALGGKVKGGGKGRWQGKLAEGQEWTDEDQLKLAEIAGVQVAS